MAVSLDWRCGIDSPPLPLVLMQRALYSFSVPLAHRNWSIAVLSCFSYLGGMLSVDPAKLIIGSNCALIIFERPTSVRHRCFQLLVKDFILSTTPSQFFWLMSAWSKQKCIPVICIVCFTGIPIVVDLIPSSSISYFSLLSASPDPFSKFSMMHHAYRFLQFCVGFCKDGKVISIAQRQQDANVLALGL
jgi:hypothetical protein